MTDTHLSETRFSSLELPDSLQRALSDCGFTHCTDIQALTLPVVLQGKDVAGQAQTGTGKTAAFLLATFTRLLTEPATESRKATQPRALILAPTRELAIQIHKDAEQLGVHSGLKMGLVYGGTGYERQRQMLEAGVDVLIGTPGRLIDYFKQGIFDLKALQVAILDEADRMFDLGFIADIRYIFRRMPKPAERQSMLFSATLSHRVLELAYEHMNNPERLVVESETVTADKVSQLLYHPASDEKIPLLIGLMRELQPPRTMVFVNTKRAAERVDAFLRGNDFSAAMLSGDVPQRKRQRLLGEFQNGDLPVLIATDVAARGLHVPGVTHVFNYDLPQQAEDYVHRIGRTARAGQSGEAISFACEEYAFSLPEIEHYIGHDIDVGSITNEMLVKPAAPKFPEKRKSSSGGKPRRGRAKPNAKNSNADGSKSTDGEKKRRRRRPRSRKPQAAPVTGSNATQANPSTPE
ncbi:MAG: ATP-dependent RNA helicase RhlB [Pseudomonadota bacterium]